MVGRVACISWTPLLAGVIALAGTGSGLAQAAAEAGAANSASAGRAARGAGGAIGSALGRLGTQLDQSTQTAPRAASTGVTRTKAQPARSRSTAVTPSNTGIHPTTTTLVAPPRQIHFDEVSFKRCVSGGQIKVDLPTDGDYVAYHCQPVSRIISFAYNGAAASNSNLTGYPSWVETDLYDFEAKVAQEDVATWQEMGLNARRAAVRGLLAKELKLKTHMDTMPNSGKAEINGTVVDHIELPAAD